MQEREENGPGTPEETFPKNHQEKNVQKEQNNQSVKDIGRGLGRGGGKGQRDGTGKGKGRGGGGHGGRFK